MALKTIKNTTTAITAIAIFVVSASVLFFSIQEHENLYRESVTNDLDGLSENMASDLLPILAVEPDAFEISTTLLRLELYENVKFAIVFDAQWQQLDVYFGNAFDESSPEPNFELSELREQAFGVQVAEDEFIGLKRVGDISFPVGFLLIVLDSLEPLQKSKLNLLIQVLPLTLLVALVAMTISFLIQRRLFLPLGHLSNLAKRIQNSHDYSLRIDVSGKQEVSDISRDINGMLDTINKETQKNKEYTSRLMEQQKTMERLINFDPLTGLPNRQFFMEELRVELGKAKNNKHHLALIYFDLDDFKGVNDSLGHETGDQLLVQVGERVKNLLDDGDIIARIAGDEFLILLHNKPSDIMLTNVGERLTKELNIPFNIGAWEVQISVSLGIAKAIDSNFNLSEFVSNADIAMYHSKTTGHGISTLFSPKMMEDSKRKLLIANAITTAIKNNEFSISYQGKVAPNEVIVGYEALIRWKSASLGVVSPAEFIPIAEQSGKILLITNWVLERVCHDFKNLQQLHNKDMAISVNLSVLDIRNPGLIAFIKQLFTRYSVDPALVEFEVTEYAYLENLEMANEFMNKLKELGSTIALDDFGTGYSSLSYLTQISFNTLKIDKQFVDNLGVSERNTLITKTIIEMAKQLNLQICAEGVETREQANFLIENGCQQLQGYFYSKPKSLEMLMKENKQLFN